VRIVAGLREIWRQLPPEQKEVVFAGIHGGVLSLILLGFRRSGVRFGDVVRRNPALLPAGLLVGTVYYSLVKRLVIEKER